MMFVISHVVFVDREYSDIIIIACKHFISLSRLACCDEKCSISNI